MNSNVKAILTVCLAFIVIGAFSGIYGNEIYKAFAKVKPPSSAQITGAEGQAAKDAPVQDINDPYSYVATGLAGLVGGVVTLIFGQQAVKSAAEISPLKSLLMTIYAAVYFVVGFCAIAAWVFPKFHPSLLLKTLALTFFGFMIPIVTSFFKDTSLAVTLQWRHSSE